MPEIMLFATHTPLSAWLPVMPHFHLIYVTGYLRFIIITFIIIVVIIDLQSFI